MALDPDLIRSLEEFGTVVTGRLVERRRPAAYRRTVELDLLERHLDQSGHNSFVLVGPSGCGKTAVLYELFRRMGRRADRSCVVLETSTSQLLAGTSYIGEWQTRVRRMIQTARRSEGVLVYFTDLHYLGDAGKSSKNDDNIASACMPFVESGELTLIGECTPDEFRSGVERLPSVQKLFGVFRIEEPPEDECDQIVRLCAEALAEQSASERGVRLAFPESTLGAVQEYGRLYFPGSAAPGGAVKLLEQLVAHAAGDAPTDASADYAVAPPVEQELPPREVGYEDVVRVLEQFTGIPGRLLDDSQPLKLGEVRKFFESRVLGQPAAVDAVLDLITLIKAGLTDPGKPMGVLFFVGPTGVGKTELAKALAEFIFGSAERMLRFDMSEFKDYHSFEKLIGGSSQPDNSALQHGSLLSRVRQQPFSVILLDEIEKAHPNVFDVLLQVFDDGRLTDPLGRTTNFTQTIVIMTSNLGSDLSVSPLGFLGSAAEGDAGSLESPFKVMEEFFRPEFLNRIDRVIAFRPLEREHVRILAQRELGQVLLRSGITRRELRVDVDPGVIDILVREGFSETFGARPLKRAVEKFALLPIARQIVGMTGDHRQALLRLLPSGHGITVRIVQDRQTRRQEDLARGVTVVDAARGTKEKLKPPEIERRLVELRAEVAALEQRCAEKRLEEQKTDLLHRTTAVDFWDYPPAARDVLGEIYRIERLLEAVGRVRKRSDALAVRFESARDKADADALAEVAERAQDVQRHMELVRYSLECRGRLDRLDAFVALSTVDTDDDGPDDDAVGLLADMYTGWARLKGFQVKLVHEELASPKRTRALTVLVEGVAVYGLLRGEDGMHEVVLGRNPGESRQSRFVKVRVLPVLDDDRDRVPGGEVAVRRQKAKGTGLRCKRYRSQVTAVHKPTSTRVVAKSELTPAEAAPLVEDLLQAELYRSRHQQAALPPSAGQVEPTIRRYTLRPQALVKDNRTGVTMTNLQDVWKGEIDEFLSAALAAREEQRGLPDY